MAKEADDFDAVLKDAIIGTEKEIFGDAFGKEELTLDETGDRGVESMGDGLEGQHEPDDEDGTEEGEEQEEDGSEDSEETEAKADGEEKPEAKEEETHADPEPRGRVPSGRLREEAEKTRAAIAERDAIKAKLDAQEAASQKAISDLNAKFEGVLAALQRQQPQTAEQPKAETPPDLFEDPTGFVNHLKQEQSREIQALRQQMDADRINGSMEMARSRHGETFDAAFNALKNLGASSPENRAFVQRLVAQPNPGEAVVTWHKRTEAIREVGDDPAAYKARIAEDTRKALMADPEFRKQILEGLRDEAMTGDNGKPRTAVKLPASLNRAGGGNRHAPNDLEIYDGSERATFDSAWST